MKNKFIALALVTLSIATTTVSCTKEGLDPTDVKSQNVETTKVAFNVSADNEVSATGKMVDKSIVPVYVNQVQIWAKSNVNPAFTVHEMFTFGTAGVGVQSGFSLDNVALGSNTFQAESWGANTDKRLSLGNVILPNASANVLDVMKAHTPYIETTNQATQPTVVITKTGNAPVGITMKTDNGRILAKFVQETPNADDYICTVSATVPTGDWDANGEVMTTLPETTITPTTGFEWSDANCRFTSKAVFTIKVYANNNGVKGALLNTITKEVAVARATTKLATFTIHNTDVQTNITSGGIVLTFPTIGEEVIND